MVEVCGDLHLIQPPNPRPTRNPQAPSMYFRMFLSPSLDRARRVQEPLRKPGLLAENLHGKRA